MQNSTTIITLCRLLTGKSALESRIPNVAMKQSNNIFILGDGADTEFSGMAQTAIQHGEIIAKNIARSIQNEPDRLEMVYPEEPIYAVPVGNNWAAVSMHGLNFYGRAGWWESFNCVEKRF